MKQVTILALIIFLIPGQILFSANKDDLNRDVTSIVKLIRMSSEPDLYGYQIQDGVKQYSAKMARYSKQEVKYIMGLCEQCIDLELATWDGMVKSYEENNTASVYRTSTDLRVQHLITQIESQGIKLQKEEEIPGAAASINQMGELMPKQDFLALLAQIRMAMKSDYYVVFNAIFF